MKKKILHSLILVLVMALIGIYALPGCSATESSDVATDNASFHFDEEEIIRQLKEKNIDSINKDLSKEVKYEKLSGAVQQKRQKHEPCAISCGGRGANRFRQSDNPSKQIGRSTCQRGLDHFRKISLQQHRGRLCRNHYL